MLSLPAISNAQFQKDLKEFEQKLSELKGSKDFIAQGLKVGGSKVEVIVKAKDKAPISVCFKRDGSLSPAEKEAETRDLFITVAHAKRAFVDVAQSMGQTILPMIDSVCGYPINDKHPHPQVAELKYPVGAHYLANLDHGIVNDTNPFHERVFVNPSQESNRRMYNLLALNHLAVSPGVNFKLDYKDDDTQHSLSLQAQAPFGEQRALDLKISSTNDTLLVARSASTHHSSTIGEGENVIGLVCGSGFNIGSCNNYQSQKNDFTGSNNTEIGGRLKGLSVLKPYITSLDQNLVEAKGEDLSLENLLACPKGKLEGLPNRLETFCQQLQAKDKSAAKQSIKELNDAIKFMGFSNEDVLKYEDMFFAAKTLQSESHKTNSYRETLIRNATNTNPGSATTLVARAFIALQLSQIIKVLASQDNSQLHASMIDTKTRRIALTGSWATNLVEAMPSGYGKSVFAEVLNRELKREGKDQIAASDIILYGDNDYDGMINHLDNALMQARAALSRASQS